MKKGIPHLIGLCLAAMAVAGCSFNRTPNFAVEPPLRKIQPDYRREIVKWTKRYYVEPSSVTFLGITDPVPIMTEQGHLWLVCVELDARARGGPYMGRRRVAFGMVPGLVSAPLERQKMDIRNQDCDAPQLVWRAWSGQNRG